MKIAIFGLGYVGCVSGGCLTKAGHDVVGIDKSELKVDLINQGKSPIVEPGMEELISQAVSKGKLKGVMDFKDAVQTSDAAIICVGTPSSDTGHLNMSAMKQVAAEIGSALKFRHAFYAIAIRSTVPPGTNRMISEIMEKKSGKTAGEDFGVVSNPEFLREGSAIADYEHPPYTILASESEKAVKVMREIYQVIDAPVLAISVRAAEMIKYVNNSFHALKVCFANEVGNICKTINVDSHELMDIFCRDTRLNISSAYFKPGFAYGGSCLPKDLKALNRLAYDAYLETPVLKSINESNQKQIDVVYKFIEKSGRKTIGILGLSFKSNTDDLRQSPMVTLVEKLIGKGYQVRIYDPNVHIAKLVGANKSYVFEKLPHLADLVTNNVGQVIDESDYIVINTKCKDLEDKIGQFPQKLFLDLVRIDQEKIILENYTGLCW